MADWLGHPQSPFPAQILGESGSIRPLPGDNPFAAVAHIVVAAADLARRRPAGVGIALNPGAKASMPICPEAVGYLASTLVARRC